MSSSHPLDKVDNHPQLESWVLDPLPPYIHTLTLTLTEHLNPANRTVPGVSVPPRVWLSSQAQWDLLVWTPLCLPGDRWTRPACGHVCAPEPTLPELLLSGIPQSLASAPHATTQPSHHRLQR